MHVIIKIIKAAFLHVCKYVVTLFIFKDDTHEKMYGYLVTLNTFKKVKELIDVILLKLNSYPAGALTMLLIISLGQKEH